MKTPAQFLALLATVMLGSSICGFLQAQVATRTDRVGKLLNEWHAAGSAAGLAAISYENRDRGHSMLDIAAWPQLRLVPPAEGDFGVAHIVRPVPVIGNCSMASPADQRGSLPRLYEVQQQGYDFLNAQYLHNNLFVYPEHQDHDRGWNGHDGWGDLFPANTACLTVSQGSSFTDKPFVRAFLSATAAFPPETQQLLVEKRLLAPTLQVLLRRSYRRAKTDDDYFTGKAHPSVFDGTQIDEDKMVMLAHGMTPSLVPPVALLEVLDETAVVPGRDFFEPDGVKDGRLGTTPCAVARVFRGAGQWHEMNLSARQSADLLGRPLQFKWVLLQGDPARVRIEPAADGTRAKVAVAWHPEFRAVDGINTHRVDIGLFVSNGLAWSAPAFLSFYMLPNEARFYDTDGRIAEICYEAGNPDVGLPPPDDLRWLALGRRMHADQPHAVIGLLVRAMSEVAVVRLESLARDLADEQDAWRKLGADPERKPEAEKMLAGIKDALRKGMKQTFDDSGRTLIEAFEDGIRAVADVKDLYLAGQDVIPDLVKGSGKQNAWSDFTTARQRMLDYRIYRQEGPDVFAFQADPSALSAAECHYLRQFHLAVLHLALFPEFLERSESPAFVDTRLTTPKSWRDVYHRDKDGSLSGWTRYTNGRIYEFDASGRLLPEGSNGPALEVRYARDEKSGKLVFAPK